VVYFTFDIAPLANGTNMFGYWLNGVEKLTKMRIRVGACAFVWAL
jgi:hypothetical protein